MDGFVERGGTLTLPAPFYQPYLMTKSLPLFILAFFVLQTFTAIAQRKLPYPIILVHGFGGKADNWGEMTDYLANQARLSVNSSYNRLNYCLNSDGNQAFASLYDGPGVRSDIYEYSTSLSDSDIYLVNFDECPNSGGSNRSAAVKQGHALGMAIKRVLSASRADKVILVGHSMGGLACREYLQNPEHWRTGDSRHHVAKLVTIGTPHGGSNLGSGDIDLGWLSGFFGFDNRDESSEAVRDLRRSYKTGYFGVYLFGGYENSQYITRGFASSYYNRDVNCNGREGDYVRGLNQKDIYTNLEYACVVGGNDLVVLVESQNLNNNYRLNAPVFYHPHSHTDAIKKAHFPTMYALDEPSSNYLAYEIQLGVERWGFLTVQADNSWYDVDRFRVASPGRGIFTVSGSIGAEAASRLRLVDGNGRSLGERSGSGTFQTEVESGNYYLEMAGYSGSGWRSYGMQVNHCSLPAVPNLTANGTTTFCQGQTVNLSTTGGYDSYQWYRDGNRISASGATLTAREAGTYTVEGSKCGYTYRSNNTVGVTVNTPPAVPTIAIAADGQGLQSSSTEGNQWFLGGQMINGQNSQTLPFSFLSGGKSVTVRVTRNGCTNESTPFVVTGTELPTVSDAKVYPNPTAGFVRVELSEKKSVLLRLFDVNGRSVLRRRVSGTAEFDLSGLATGVYVLRISGQAEGIRIVKE